VDYGVGSRMYPSPFRTPGNNADDRLPLITISIVRTISFTMYTSTKRILNSSPTTSTSSRKGKEREVEAPWVDLKLGMFNGNSAKDVAVTSLLAGGASGAVVCVGSAPFELVKVGTPSSLFLVLILLS
jgi:solute carrier family 25 carnitine/acylcarnitine transporter 20/29